MTRNQMIRDLRILAMRLNKPGLATNVIIRRRIIAPAGIPTHAQFEQAKDEILALPEYQQTILPRGMRK